MRILVFEFITGGGLNNKPLPHSLVQEGELMRLALLLDLMAMPAIEVSLLHDPRVPLDKLMVDNQMIKIIPITPQQDFWQVLAEQAPLCDAVWPIAPESEGILEAISYWVEESGLKLLGSSSEAVALTADKYRLFKRLEHQGIPVVKTYTFAELDVLPSGPWVLKPRDGVGCEGIVQVKSIVGFKAVTDPERFIIQPFEAGKLLSLSCLFKGGRGALICMNEQRVKQNEETFELESITVNVDQMMPEMPAMVEQLANTIPGLWGYVGIDLILSTEGLKVLEVNPRLTTAYSGIRLALGSNLGASIIALLTGGIDFKAQSNQSIIVEIPREKR
jgi:predicted ATP-grasp superfamily ATP-dependent carboligase